MENTTKESIALTAFQRRERVAQKKSEMGNAVHECLGSFRRRTRRPETHRRSKRNMGEMRVLKERKSEGCGDDEDEKVEVERKIMALKSIVPGGESLGIEKLFDETAVYILALEGQVKAMRVLASFFEGLEKEQRKSGG